MTDTATIGDDLTATIVHRGAVGLRMPAALPVNEVMSFFTDEQVSFFSARFVDAGVDALKAPAVFIPVGPPASGKSTWTSSFLRKTKRNTAILSSDDLIEVQAKLQGLTYAEAWAKVDMKALEREMDSALREAVADNSDIIVDRTNMRVKSRKRWLSQIPKHYVKVAVVFSIPLDEIKARLAHRQATTGKEVPFFVVKNMLETYEAPSLKEFDLLIYIGEEEYDLSDSRA